MIVACLLLAALPPLDGVAVPYYPREGAPFPPDLAEVRALGARGILVPNPFVLAGPTAAGPRSGPDTLSATQVLALAKAAKAEGLAWVYMPFLTLAEGSAADWRGNLRPADPEEWWRSYQQLLVQAAELAQRGEASGLVIGSELSSLSGEGTEGRWAQSAAVARRLFGGPLIYAANHDAVHHTAPYGSVDIIGVSAYHALSSDPDAGVEVLVKRWRGIAHGLAELSLRHQKPVWVVELGYPSRDGAAVRPWDYGSGGVLDLEEQRAAYFAATLALSQTPEVEAVFFWQWHGTGGSLDRGYSVRGKPAERVLRRYFQARASMEPRPDHRQHPGHRQGAHLGPFGDHLRQLGPQPQAEQVPEADGPGQDPGLGQQLGRK